MATQDSSHIHCGSGDCNFTAPTPKDLETHKRLTSHWKPEEKSIPCTVPGCPSENFATLQELSLHRQQSHLDLTAEDRGRLLCGYENCTYSATTKTSIKTHKEKEGHWKSEEKSLACRVPGCLSSKFATRRELSLHEQQVHPDLSVKELGRIPCGFENCTYSAATKSSIISHKKTQGHWTAEDKTFPCEVADCSSENFLSQHDLDRHQREVHPEIFIFACDVENCDRTFQARNQLTDHKRFVHSVDHFQYACRYTNCHQLFSQPMAREMHQKNPRIHPEDHPCDYTGCSACFDNSNDLLQHKAGHASETPFKCNVRSCPHSFPALTEQLEHEKVEHSRSLCELCSTTFPSVTESLSHALSDHAPVRCDYCKETYKKRHSLRAHLEFHNGGQQISVVQLLPSIPEGTEVEVVVPELNKPINTTGAKGLQAQPGKAQTPRHRSSRPQSTSDSASGLPDLGILDPQAQASAAPSTSGTRRAAHARQAQTMLAYDTVCSQQRSSSPFATEESPVQQFTVRSKSQKFKDSLLARPAGRVLTTLDQYDKTINALLAGPALQRVTSSVDQTKDGTSLSFAEITSTSNQDPPQLRVLAFDIEYLNLDDEVVGVLEQNLKQILERSLVNIFDLPWTRTKWLLHSAVLSTAAQLPHFRPSLPLPILLSARLSASL